MNTKCSTAVLLTHNDLTYAKTLKEELRKYNYDLLYVNGMESFVDFVIDTKKCLVFIDSKYSKYRFLIKNLVEKTEYFKTLTIIYIDDKLDRYISYTNNLKLFAIKKNEFSSKIREIIEISNTSSLSKDKINKDDFSNCLTEYLLKIGFSPKYVGFEYLKQILLLSANNGFKLTCLQRNIFPRIAVVNNVPQVNIERNIRWIIKKTYNIKSFEQEYVKVIGRLPKKITTKAILSSLLHLSYMYYQKCYNKINN